MKRVCISVTRVFNEITTESAKMSLSDAKLRSIINMVAEHSISTRGHGRSAAKRR
jgi:hypothetical protein